MKRTKQMITGILAAAFLAVSLSGCQIGDTEFVMGEKPVDNKTVFTINDKKCNIRQAKLYLCNYKNLYGNAYGVDIWDYDFGEADLEQYVKDVTLSELSRIMCMDLLAKQQEIELTSKEDDLVASAAKEYYASLSAEEKDFMGIQESDVRQAYEDYALANKLYDTLTQGTDAEVSDDEARVMRIQQIYVTDSATADDVSSKLAAGEDFASVAASYNEAGEIERTIARGDYPKVVEEVAFNLNNETYSGQIETEDGFYFIKCLNKFEQELTEANKDIIRIQREKEQFEDVYTEFVETADFEINDAVWDAIVIDPSIPINTDTFFTVYDKYFK